MLIENYKLKKVYEEDIPEDGVFVVPDNIVEIGAYAFKNSNNLKNIVFGDNVRYIREGAFQFCYGLTNIIIPKNIIYFGQAAFSGCSNLNGVYISDIDKWCNITFADLHSNPLFWAQKLYLNGELVKDLSKLNKVEYIGDFAFARCSEFVNLIVPDGVKTIGVAAFERCPNIESIVMPNSIIAISTVAFAACRKLKSVTAGDNLSYLGLDVFGGCANIENINISNKNSNKDTIIEIINKEKLENEV